MLKPEHKSSSHVSSRLNTIYQTTIKSNTDSFIQTGFILL